MMQKDTTSVKQVDPAPDVTDLPAKVENAVPQKTSWMEVAKNWVAFVGGVLGIIGGIMGIISFRMNLADHSRDAGDRKASQQQTWRSCYLLGKRLEMIELDYL